MLFVNLLKENYVDLLIIVILSFFIFEGIRHGFWVILADFFAFLFSLLFALKYYPVMAQSIKGSVPLNPALDKALAFLLLAVVTEAILGFLLGYLVNLLPKNLCKKKMEKILAVFPAIGEALVIVSFILILILSLPVKPQIKKDLIGAKLGSVIIAKTQGVEVKLKDIFGGAIEDSLTYLIIKPESKEWINLSVEEENLVIDQEAEGEIFALTNKERENAGKRKLVWEDQLARVAREYAMNMWQKKYFGHYSPEGEDVADRLKKVDINYFTTGENLALAPTVLTAFTGLMQSEGHRHNILDNNFEKAGMGVVDNGIYGKMFVQIFIK